MNALETPVRHGKQDHAEARRFAELAGVVPDIRFARRVKVVGIPEQHELATLPLGDLHRFDVFLERIEHRVMDEHQLAAGFVVPPLDELAVFVQGDRDPGDEQRRPEAVFDLLADVVAYPSFVETT